MSIINGIVNPDGWYKILENAIQHEIQHHTKKPIKPSKIKSARRDSNSTAGYLKGIIPDETLTVYNCLPIFR